MAETTETQQRVMKTFAELRAVIGRNPSLGEMAEQLNISRQGVRRVLLLLEREGHMEKPIKIGQSWRMTNRGRGLLKTLASALLLVGCGGESGEASDDQIDLIDTQAELGEASYAITARPGYGWMESADGNSQDPCTNPVPAGKVCFLPATKTVKTHAANSLGARQSSVEFDINSVNVVIGNGFIQGWTIAQEFTQANANVLVSPRSESVGALATNIEEYIKLDCTSQSGDLAESPSHPGKFRKCNKIQCGIRYAAIEANYTNATQQANMKNNALSYCISLGFGLGPTPPNVTDRANSRTITPGSKKSSFGTQDNCRANSYVVDNNAVNVTGVCNG